jgi:hypothetical protein
VGLISICFFGYSKKYRFLRTQGQIITPTILLKPVGSSLPFFIEMIFGGAGGKLKTYFFVNDSKLPC